MLIKRYYRYSMLMPGLLIFLIFFVAPSLASFFYAFTNLDSGFKFSRFVGWSNFISIFDETDNVLALKNTLIFTIITSLLKVSLGLSLAIFVNMKLKTALYLRSMLFFPAILSTVAVSLAFTAILHPSDGVLNIFLRFVHLDVWAQSWLTDPHVVIYTVSMVEVWKWTGYMMVLFLAALQTIPKDVVESALIDGVTFWQKFWHITVPTIFPVIKVITILSLIGGLKVFDLVYTLTGGGPGESSSVIGTMIYKSFANGRDGEGIAANLVLFIIVLVSVLGVNKLMNKETEG